MSEYKCSAYITMVRNQQLLLSGLGRSSWEEMAGFRDAGMRTHDERKQIETQVYRIMRNDHILRPRGSKTDLDTVEINGEKYSERWLKHYYFLRHFQPCREIASFLASRMTGEYHNGKEVSFEKDIARLCAAQNILARQRQAWKHRGGVAHMA